MTVQQILDELNKIEDKSLKVFISDACKDYETYFEIDEIMFKTFDKGFHKLLIRSSEIELAIDNAYQSGVDTYNEDT